MPVHHLYKLSIIETYLCFCSPGIILRKDLQDQICMEGMTLGTKMHIWDQIQGEVHLQVKGLPMFSL